MIRRIDHVHVEVRSRAEAAAWLERVLGLKPDDSLTTWAAHPRGPLILKTAKGERALALFERPDGDRPQRDHTIAFVADGRDWLTFLREVESLALVNGRGERLTARSFVDHDLSWSIYFIDPDGNRFEVTTYDYDEVAIQLGVQQ